MQKSNLRDQARRPQEAERCVACSRGESGVRSLVALLLLIGLFAIPASAQVPLPHTELNVSLDDLVDVETVTFDAGTLPARAHVEVSVLRPPTHPDLEVELRMTCPIGCLNDGGMPFDRTATLSVGESVANFSLAESCAPSSPHVGIACDIEALALGFGAAGAPASIDLHILGYTSVPFYSEQVEFDPVPQQTSLAFEADRDTTLYEEQGDWNNGLGNSVWAGRRYNGTFPTGQFHRLHGLMTFDVSAPLVSAPGKIPPSATIDDAFLMLRVLDNRGPISSVSISAVTDVDNNPFSTDDWYSGTTDAPGSEIESLPSTSVGATWDHREFPIQLWNTPGAATGPVLATAFIPTLGQGTVSFNSPALTDEVRTMWSTRRDTMGFQYRGASNPFSFDDQAVRFASKDYPFEPYRPELLVYYTPEFADPYVDDFLPTGTIPFIGEGENFRWVYDDDQDDVLFTPIGGRCEETAFGEEGLLTVPYNYSYQGDENFVGLDCCTWQIESQATGTLGTGQALFFINLNAADPANYPPDTDGDGIADLCDNCPYTPNGPFMGTCVGGPDGSQTCRSDLECASPSFCSLSQQDDDFVLPGQACPEPGMGVMLMVGTLSIVGLRRSVHPSAVRG